MNTVFDLSAPVFCILLCVTSGIGWLLWKRNKWQFRYWLIPMLMFYALILIKLTIFPINIYDKETLGKITQGAGKYLVFYQLTPLASIKNYLHGSAIIQLIGNMVLLSPLTVFAEIFFRQRSKAWVVALGVSAFSLLIEVIQLVINLTTRYPNRVADIDDLILNIAGVVITMIITRTLGKRQRIKKAFRKLLYR